MSRLSADLPAATVGECMIELVRTGPASLGLGFAGDTLNTAVYLARSLGAAGRVDFVTAVGDDAYSDEMVNAWVAEGIGVAHVARLAGGRPGLYLVAVDDSGERSFTYYRSDSAARQLFDRADPFSAGGSLADYGLAYLSGITLSVLSSAGRDRLWAELEGVRRAGGTVAFDSNYRPAGWPDRDSARAAVARTLTLTDIALPSFDDEQSLFGDATPHDCITRLHNLGVGEVALTDGARPSLVSAGRGPVPVDAPPVVAVVDTTAAGDSFNGGYLAARLRGADPVEATRAGGALAGRVIGHPGAVIQHAAPPTDPPP